ncbi:DMATS type aromatic prenyltransferase [Streptomyces umbrinus]|uniref:DMATS type aromatic prenyltransferase n=1 Tax=Streptomyces umbrinus TaxID=67370 RepID=A0ABU0SM67_9ACTN|nr:tryptophan dimethylallyltransferase family protein [Streptomyces umbrinus]MDQ1024645.1 DMATS type aromatic prenyltransferase [Streptomyces umbrinus]
MTPSRTSGGSTRLTKTLGRFTADQLRRLCDVVGLDAADAETYASVLAESLGTAAERPLDLPPPSRSFLSDDHTPVEFSLSFQPGETPTLRVLLEPGCDAASLVDNGRVGLRVIHAMTERWGFSSHRLDHLEDLFFPPASQGPLALWCALELRPGGVPRLKVYLNPAASGPERAGETIREALGRLGYQQAYTALPPADGYPFFALDLGDWDAPRVKIYLRHHNLAVAEAGSLPRMDSGPEQATVEAFFRIAAGYHSGTRSGAGTSADARLCGLPALACHSFTETTTGLPSGFTLHIPIRDYVRHDGEAHARAVAVLAHYGMDATPLARSLAAVTSRQPADGTGLIAYLALAYERSRPPRVTAYISSEAYGLRPLAAPLSPRTTPLLNSLSRLPGHRPRSRHRQE